MSTQKSTVEVHGRLTSGDNSNRQHLLIEVNSEPTNMMNPRKQDNTETGRLSREQRSDYSFEGYDSSLDRDPQRRYSISITVRSDSPSNKEAESTLPSAESSPPSSPLFRTFSLKAVVGSFNKMRAERRQRRQDEKRAAVEIAETRKAGFKKKQQEYQRRHEAWKRDRDFAQLCKEQENRDHDNVKFGNAIHALLMMSPKHVAYEELRQHKKAEEQIAKMKRNKQKEIAEKQTASNEKIAEEQKIQEEKGLKIMQNQVDKNIRESIEHLNEAAKLLHRRTDSGEQI